MKAPLSRSGISIPGIVDGEKQFEHAALAGLGFDLNPTLVGIHDMLHDGQAQTGAADAFGLVRVDPIERIE